MEHQLQLPRVREKGQRLKISKIKKLLRGGCITHRTQEEASSPIASHHHRSHSVRSSQCLSSSHSHSENSSHQSQLSSHSRSENSSHQSQLSSHSRAENSSHQSSQLSSHSHSVKSPHHHQFHLSSHAHSVQPSQPHLSLSLLQIITQRPLLEEPLLSSGYKIGVDESLSAGAGPTDEKWRCDVPAKTDVIPEDQDLDSLPLDQAMQLIDTKEDSLEDWPSYMPWSKGVGLLFGPLSGLCCCLGRNKICLQR